MKYFVPALPERERNKVLAGYELPDPCANCGLDFMEHTNGRCPGQQDRRTQPGIRPSAGRTEREGA